MSPRKTSRILGLFAAYQGLGWKCVLAAWPAGSVVGSERCVATGGCRPAPGATTGAASRESGTRGRGGATGVTRSIGGPWTKGCDGLVRSMALRTEV